MSFILVHRIVALFLTVVILLLFFYLLYKAKMSKVATYIFLCFLLLFAFPLWYVIGFFVYDPIAYLMWKDPTVPCFMLEEDKCEQRLNCSVSYIEFGSSGFSCFPKLQR